VEGATVSAAEFVDDVNNDPVVILDGLTKGWRCPGWRLSWIVGPASVIEAATSAGSFLDGGGNRPLQEAACALLEPARARAEVVAIHGAFARKRRLLIDGLRAAGLTVEHEPEGGFYVWASVTGLPAPLNDGEAFFEAALREQVITVPGIFFDINPGKRRADHTSRFRQYLRFSFGPDESSVCDAVQRIQDMVARARG
jgi:aspartate/methionine/tyrosine aminotransferase